MTRRRRMRRIVRRIPTTLSTSSAPSCYAAGASAAGRKNGGSRPALRLKRKTAGQDPPYALPVHLRQVVDLRYVQNLSVAEIAERLGHETRHVAAALERARAHLEQSLFERRGRADADA